jgi:hypothetical protein
MAFPFTFNEHFELGTIGSFNSETDTDNKLDIVHYPLLAGSPIVDIPWAGAYCMRIDLAGGTNDALLTELEGFDVNANTAAHVRFYLFVSRTLTMAASDTFDILRWDSAGPVIEFSINLFNNAGVIEIRAGDTGGATLRSSPLERGRWHSVELSINTGTGANGTCDFFLNGGQVGAQVGSIASAALTQARLGAMGIDAGTTAGVLLFDAIVVDDTRVYPQKERYPATLLMTGSGHAAVGPGRLASVNLLAGAAADNIVSVYDTDQANTADAGNIIAQVSNSAASETEQVDLIVSPSGGYFKRGCYVTLSGTNPRALLTFAERYQSKGLIRSYGLRRVPHII